MIKKKYIFITILTAFALLGCGGNSTDTTVSTQNPGEQFNGSDGTQPDDQVTDDASNDEEAGPVKKSVVETKPSNWYIRLVAEDPSRAMKAGDTQLGELEESDAVSKHTLKALSPFGGSYVDIVFRDPAGVDTGDYKVNFHQYNEDTEESWQFTVRTDDANADILLSWRGLYVLTPYVDDQDRQRYREYRSLSNPLIQNMKLVDVNSGKEIAAAVDGKVQTYVFNMNGQNERTFEWIVQTDVVDIPVNNSKSSTLQATALKKDAAAEAKSITERKAETFDLSRPPMIKEEINGK